MPTIHDALLVLYPAANEPVDYSVVNNGSDQQIVQWNAALGPQPTPAELAAVTQAQVDAAKAVKRRAAASAIFDGADGDGQILRAMLLTLVDEVNLLRQRLAAQDAVVAAATTLANLKTGWATMASARPVPDRTPAQAKNAIASKLNSGGAD
jgi:hypothetical protein